MLPRLNIRSQNCSYNPQQQLINQKSLKIIKPYIRQFSQASLKTKKKYSFTLSKQQDKSICIQKLKSRINRTKTYHNSEHQTVKYEEMRQIQQQQHSFRSKRYETIQQQFQSMKRNKNYFQEKSIDSFVEIIQKINPLFHRIGTNLSKILLQKFALRSYAKGDFVYKEGQFSKNIYILLWGEALLKNKAKTFTKYVDPGDSLAQDPIINQKSGKRNFKGLNSYYSHNETAKVLSTSGVLSFTLAQYRQLREQLIPLGFRRQLKIFQNLLLWSYTKKTGFRTRALE